MSDPAVIEAAARALMNPKSFLSYDEAQQLVTAVLATATPLIRAAALEEAAKVAEGYYPELHDADVYDAQQTIAAAIRALKEQP